MDLQLELSRAFQNRDLNTFEGALKLHANPNQPDDYNITIFEKALATAGCGEYIKLCLQYGCSGNYINTKNKAALNFASDSRDSENLKVILDQTTVHLNNKYNGLTPINSLAKNLTAENASEVTKCIRLLLEKGACPNIADNVEMRPLNYVIFKKIEPSIKQELVDLFLQRIDIYLDEELRAGLLHWNPQLNLPNASIPSSEVNKEQLLRALRTGNEGQFCQWLGNYEGDCIHLYEECITNGHHIALDSLLQHYPTKDRQKFVEFAIAYGNWCALDKLLQNWQIPKNMDVLSSLVCRLDERPQKSFSDFVKCFDILLRSGQVNLNMQDESGRTPLHYATIYNHEYAVQQLLLHGASLNIDSVFAELGIDTIEPELLEEHFDNYITSNGKSRAAGDFEVTLNFGIFKIPHDMKFSRKSHSSEMRAIRAIGNSKAHRHLLNHPLITSLIVCFKWQNISKQHYIYFTMSVALHLLMAFNILFIYTPEVPGILKFTFMALSWWSIAYLITVEMAMFVLLGFKLYFTRWRWINAILVVLAVCTNICAAPDSSLGKGRIFAAFTIVLIAIRLIALVGSLPTISFSLYVLMLWEVCYTFMKSWLLYSVLLIAFGLSFYLLDVLESPNTSIVGAVIKTIVMSTGEFEESSIKFEEFFFARLFFIAFVLFIAIVLMNLLSALAFSDIQAIQAAAEVYSLNSLVDLLMSYDMCLDKYKFLKKFLKSTEIPELAFAYPNEEKFEITPTNNVEMEPLISANATTENRINIPPARVIINLSKVTVKRIHQLMEKRSKRKSNCL
ncbi:transient receptor potential cation channel protein painless-like [Drosophila sulfurigaster albostrigata]|uniref:transient receptor potential cation channel protein painless-like n=1 Tax=Drosophila sulfurigaster albostrigata TaxID=89887 RepID=UPI002D21DC1B|nr:transient receptor potential cation channel protein painless-like [Drosophila sulfurigaster albostrigata]